MIAIDWGTSSLRAYRLDADGHVAEQRSAPLGLLASQGRFEATLAEQTVGWDDDRILMAGMIGSRGGWCEVPYVACPAGADEIAGGMLEVAAPSLPGRRIFIAPGMSHRPADGPPDVIRGEETQLVGLLDELDDAGAHTVCLPGTHSKWATLRDRRITEFHTAMTGELYALLVRHSLLGALMDPETGLATDDEAAFALGVDASRRAGGLSNHLFGVRARGLFGELTPAAAPSFLSGLLIGHELQSLVHDASVVHLVGGDALVRRYGRALALHGVEAVPHGEALTACGLHRLAASIKPGDERDDARSR